MTPVEKAEALYTALLGVGDGDVLRLELEQKGSIKI
jgi:hypothetical protein